MIHAVFFFRRVPFSRLINDQVTRDKPINDQGNQAPKKKLKCFFSERSKSSTQTSNQANSKMSATIMMPQQIDAAIKEMCSDAMGQAVAVLAEKYGFDADEANRLLSSEDLKIVRKRGPAASPKAEKPKKADKASKADKPKRAKTGYLLYADEVREEIRESLASELGDDEKLKPQDVVRAIAAQWKAEEQEVRDEWNAKAKTPEASDEE